MKYWLFDESDGLNKIEKKSIASGTYLRREWGSVDLANTEAVT